MTAPILRSAHVRRPIDEVFVLFTDQIGSWWPLPTHGLFAERSAGVAFVDGQLVERADDGTTTTWGEVLEWTPPHLVSMTWHPGREHADASTVEVRFTADDDGTRIDLCHRGWETFGEAAEARRRSYVGPNAWGYVLDFFCSRSESDDGADELAALAAAYEQFFAEAAAGGFADPPAGEWTADQVVAHVAVNDDAMATICRSLVHEGATTFDNRNANDHATLDTLVADASGTAALIATARQRARVLIGLLATLDDDQRASEVSCHLVDHGEVVLDRPLPWGQLAIGTQANFHLPLHTRQLQDLRATSSP